MKPKIALVLLLLVAIFFSVAAFFPAPPAKDSVVVIDTTREVTFDPSPLFLMGPRVTLWDLRDFSLAGKIQPPPPPRIVHARGGGFVVSGHLITAAHVILPNQGEKIISIEITSIRGAQSKVSVLRVDKANDLAELSLDIVVPSLHLALTTPKEGDAVTQIGHPNMIHWVVSRGEIVGFDVDQGYNIAALDTFSGNSGGPVLNKRGQVIGVCHNVLRGSRFTGIGTLTALHYFLYPSEVR